MNVVAVRLPSLREHRSDIPQLVHYFLDRYAPGQNIQVMPEAIKCLLEYDWPGNVRELENYIARAVTLGDDQIIGPEDLPPAVRGQQPASLIEADNRALSTTALADLERITIERVFEQAGGDKALAGKMLGSAALRYIEN